MNELKNYGLKIDDKDENAYVLGGGMLSKIILQPDGNWERYLPQYEPQFNAQYDSYGCTVWSIENVVETMLKKIEGIEYNFSERFIYILANIVPPGADPHYVMEVCRERGLIADALLPMTPSYEWFLTPKPMTENLLEEGLKFKYEVKHEYLWSWRDSPTKEERLAKIREALQYSPIAVSVTAWIEENGVYVDNGQPNTHLTMLYAIGEKGYMIFDSYDSSIKVLSFDHNIQIAKRFHLEKSNKLQQVSLLQKIISKLKQLIEKYAS